jgi:topoisomerase-4 subunit A
LTEIQGEIEEIKVDIAMQINAEDCMVTLTNEGYIKRTSPRSFKSMGGTIDTCGVKEGDKVRYFAEANTSHTALFFTQDGKYFATLVNDIPDEKWKDVGSALVNVIPLEKHQRIVGFHIVKDFKQPLYVCHLTRSGLIKKTALSEYETNRSGPLVAAKLKSEDDEFVSVLLAGEEGSFLAVTRDGMGIRFLRSEVSPTGRASSGVKAINMVAGDEAIALLATGGAEDERVFTLLTAEGVLKRTRIADIPLQGRAGKGVQLIRKRKTNPHQLVAAAVEETLYALTEKGEWVRVQTEHVSVNEQGGIGRMAVDDGVKAVAFEAVLPVEESKDTAGGKEPQQEAPVSPHDEAPVTQFSLFDDSTEEKE